MNKKVIVIALALLFLIAGIDTALADVTEKDWEKLGKVLFFDESLSTPEGQSCASCHDPDAGFADPDNDIPVSEGVIPGRFGARNTPSAAYAKYSPDFGFDTEEGIYIGGQFWDGRAATLEEQAKGPFLNELEMNNPNKVVVLEKIKNSNYANQFEKVTGVDLDDLSSEENINNAYDKMAEAIAAYERTDELNQFSSKYDLYLAGKAKLTDSELRGLALFENPDVMCSDCHPSQQGPNGELPLFTDFTYDNLGTPKNPDNPFYDLPKKFNPDGDGFIDYGLGGILDAREIPGAESEMGKVKVPTLRNIAVTSPYIHNGVFDTLTDVVTFYNERDTMGVVPEVAENVNKDELGDLGLSDDDIADIVAFLETLTDGYQPKDSKKS